MAMVKKDSLQSLLAGEPIPLLPAFSPEWDLKRYNDEMANWQRKLVDYLRRLLQRLTGDNIFNEIIQQSTINQYITNIINGLTATQYGFGPVKIEVFKDYLYVDATTPFGGTPVGTIFTASLAHPENIQDWPGVGDNFSSTTSADPSMNLCASLRVTCKITPSFTENYTFTLAHDDGARMWIGGTLVLDNWGSAGTDTPAAIALTAGVPQTVRIELNNHGGQNLSFRLSWNSASETFGEGWDIPFAKISKP